MVHDTIDYTHGDTGSKPAEPLNFEKNERPDAQHFDWFWYTVIQSLNSHAEEFERIDADHDGTVDSANHAGNADQLGGNDPIYYAPADHDHDSDYWGKDETVAPDRLVLPVGQDMYDTSS